MRRTGFAILLAGLLACGCGEQIYRAETVVHPGGVIDRAVYQPFDETPEAARAPGEWARMTRARPMPAERWATPISQLPFSDNQELGYFSASGRFASAAAIPVHLQIGTAEPPLGRLVPRFTETDYVVAVEFLWEETLHESVSLVHALRASREVAALLGDVFLKSVAEYLGPDYELAPLANWLNTEGRDWVEELAAAYYESASRKDGDRPPLEIALCEVAALHGLELLDDGKLAGQAVLHQRARDFTAAKLKSLIRGKDGADIPQQDLLAIVDNIISPGTDRTEAATRFEQAVERVISRDFGGKKALEAGFDKMFGDIFGLLGAPLFSPPKKFHYTTEVPGQVVETNGRLLASGRVDWRFEWADAYPQGYPMRVRSLVSRGETQKTLFQREVLTSQQELVEAVEVLANTPDLLKALKDCAAAKSLDPLNVLKDQSANDDQLRGRIERFERLLD